MSEISKLTVVPKMDTYTKEKIVFVISTIRSAGYDPFSQLYGYVTTGNAAYITRKNDARTIIQTIDKKQLQSYIRYLATA